MSKYHRWVDSLHIMERRVRPSSMYLFLLVVVALILGALSHYLWSDKHLPVENSSTEQLETLTKQLNAQAGLLASKNLELTLALETNAKMQQLFTEQHLKERELERELNFYRSIMAPENDADGVAIHDLELTPGLLPHQYRLQLILTQLHKRKQTLQGRAEIMLLGVQDGKSVELNLAELVDINFKFQFRYFQMLATDFILPTGFELSRVIAKVTVPKSRWAKGSQATIEYTASELMPREHMPIEPMPVDNGPIVPALASDSQTEPLLLAPAA